MVDYVFPQDYITQKGSHGKYPVKTGCASDDLSGDMLAPSWPNLVRCLIPPYFFSYLACMVDIFRFCFYCATIAYHVGLNANSGGRRTPANDQEKWTFGFA